MPNPNPLPNSPITPAVSNTAEVDDNERLKKSEVPNEPVTYDDMLMDNDFHVSRHPLEVWSPPRVTAVASQYGLVPGSAYDIEVNDANGTPWDFDVPEKRNK